MRLSELTILYFAAAAPFGVAHFNARRGGDERHVRALLAATVAALAWPFMVMRFVLARGAAARAAAADEGGAGAQPLDEQRIEQVKRATVNALRKVEDVYDDAGAQGGADERHSFFAARECVERYTGLALAAAQADADAGPSSREMELCRIAGRAGDDLLVAGRCTHRRNVTRLVAHRERARSELVHALAGVRELIGSLQLRVSSLRPPSRPGSGPERQASEAMLRALARAVELLSLFDDRATIVKAARLLDAECARLRRLEDAAGAGAEGPQEGDGKCTTQAADTVFATALLHTTTSSRA